MNGRPLTEALRCVEYIASRMTAADQLAVVVYYIQVQVPRALAPVTSLNEVTQAIAGIESGGSTDVPMEIVGSGDAAVKRYLARMANAVYSDSIDVTSSLLW